MAADPMGPAEIERALERIDRLMTTFVTEGAWMRENNHLRDQIAELDRDCRERTDDVEKAADARFKRIEDRGQNAWVRILGVLGIAATLIAAVWAAYLSSRGAH